MSKVQAQSYSFEDAIHRTKYGKFNYFMIVLSGLILACGLMEINMINVILPLAQCELHLTDVHKGLLGSIGYIGIILFSHICGFIADTKGRKAVLIPSLFLTFFFTVLSILSKSFWAFTLFRFLNGLCICAPQTIIYAYLSEFHSAHHRSRVLISASVLYGLFGLLTPINGYYILNHDNWNFYIPVLDLNIRAWRIFLIVCGFPSVLSGIAMLLFVPESPKFTFAHGDEPKTLKILQIIYSWNTGRPAEDYEVKSLIKDDEFHVGMPVRHKGFFHFMWSQTTPLFKSPHLKVTLTACYLQFGICVVANGFWTFFPETLNEVSLWMAENPNGSETVCGIIDDYNIYHNASSVLDRENCINQLELSTFINLAMLTTLYSIFWFIMSLVINKVGKLIVMLIVTVTCGTASILMIFIQSPTVSIYTYLIFLLSGLNMSIVNTSTVELFPTAHRGMAVTISMMCGRLGSVVGSNFVGIMIKHFCTYIWILPTVLLYTGGLLMFTIPNINKRE